MENPKYEVTEDLLEDVCEELKDSLTELLYNSSSDDYAYKRVCGNIRVIMSIADQIASN